ncbi:MAG: hypothetical protein ACLUS6_03810 [Dysosmobacter sp.]
MAAGRAGGPVRARSHGETGYSLDIKDLRRRLKDAFLLLACCDGDNRLPGL